MAGLDHSTARKLVNQLTALVSAPDRNEHTNGTVTRIDKDGTIWVRFVGASSDTPCTKSSVAVKQGDSVGVSISGKRATIYANYTSPATDDTTANSALEKGSSAERVANTARKMSKSAIESASRAADAASEAEEYAEQASLNAAEVFGYLLDVEADWEEIEGYVQTGGEKLADIAEMAEQAQTDAASAATSATSAAQSAYNAQVSSSYANAKLSDVENVVGMLDWISDPNHATYEATTDTYPVNGKLYWQRSGTSPDYVYTPVEEVPMTYTATADTVVDVSKTYYAYDSTTQTYSPVTPTGTENPSSEGWYEGARNPQASGLYVLKVDESIDGYIAAHAAMTQDGLMLTGADKTTQMLLCTNPNSTDYDVGVTIMVNNENVGFYGENSIIGRESGAHITIGTVKDYALTTDTTINDNKTYYTRSQSQPYTYTEVLSPNVSDIATYYELVDSPRIGFWQGNQEVAWVSNNELHIPRTVVLDSMQIGNWLWENRSNGNLRLSWVGA